MLPDIRIDASGKYLFPGIIDDQVHFREPGLTHKANIYSESKGINRKFIFAKVMKTDGSYEPFNLWYLTKESEQKEGPEDAQRGRQARDAGVQLVQDQGPH